MFRDTPLAEKAKVSAIAKDISEVLVDLDIPEQAHADLRVAYHAACSLQHGQKIEIVKNTVA